jgi:hypothetical protein
MPRSGAWQRASPSEPRAAPAGAGADPTADSLSRSTAMA